jgi:broad specificity phosphatase PhoE
MAVITSISTIRHAQTTYGEQRRYAGAIDVPLSESGIRDARMAARHLESTPFDVVVSSALNRALETARLLVGDRDNIRQTPLCNERNFGAIQGLTYDEVKQLDPPLLFIKVGDDTHSVNPAGGEPFEVLWDRAKKFRNLLFREHCGLRILVVSHGVFLQMFHGVLRSSTCIESLAYYPLTLQLTTFTFSGRRLLEEKSSVLSSPEQVRF